jgi:hypothetical protein
MHHMSSIVALIVWISHNAHCDHDAIYSMVNQIFLIIEDVYLFLHFNLPALSACGERSRTMSNGS